MSEVLAITTPFNVREALLFTTSSTARSDTRSQAACLPSLIKPSNRKANFLVAFFTQVLGRCAINLVSRRSFEPVNRENGDSMILQPVKSVSLSSVAFFSIILAGAMGWVIVLNQVHGHHEGVARALIEIIVEIIKVVVIAAAAAVAVERVLLREPEDDVRVKLRNVGIRDIFLNRQSAASEFLVSIEDDNIRHITITGISLRDFLRGGGTLYQVWRDICARLKREESANIPPDQRLNVRLLILSPNSDEGYFRHSIESENQENPSGIPFDIPNALNTVRGTQQEIFGRIDPPFLQIRLYEHCPFSFIFATDTQLFVEQYDYRDQREQAAMPLITYQSGTQQYKEQMFSLDVIWAHARPADLFDEVGTAAAVREAGIKNIFRRDHRSLLTIKQVRAIQSAKKNSVDILAISGRFYVSNPSIARELQDISRPDGNRSAVPIRVAIINPISQQAILRAVADSSPPDEVGEHLRKWNWMLHQQTDLYRDTRTVANTLFTWSQQRGCDVQVRMYSSSVACMILQTDKQAFVEQYMYGRSKAFQPGFVLGGDYPVIEYDVSDVDQGEMIEHQVIAATFGMIWKFYSIAWEDYVASNEQEEFEANLARLRAELKAT